MSTEPDVSSRLDQLDALDRRLAAIRSAPQPLEAQLAQAHAEFTAAAALFRAEPWSQRAGVRGALAALLPKQVATFELDRVRHRAAADQRETLDDATRRQRVTAAEAAIAGLLAGLSPGDLHALQQARDAAHAKLRGLTQHRDELQVRVDRRGSAMALLEREREAEPYRPADPPLWPGYDPAGQPALTNDSDGIPRLTESVPPPPLTRAERSARDDAIAAAIADETAALDRDKAALASAEAECNDASVRWREAAAEAERCAKWLRRKPITAVPLAAE